MGLFESVDNIMNWETERNAVLNWWPVRLRRQKTQGHMLVDSLEDAAWGCSQESDWAAWLNQVEKIWPHLETHFLDKQSNPQDTIDVHLGPTLGQALLKKCYFPHRPLELFGGHLALPTRSGIPPEIDAMASKLCDEFAIHDIIVTRGSSALWIRKQLTDAQMGLGSMALSMSIPAKHVGKNHLHLWMSEHSGRKGANAADHDHIEIHQSGGNIAQAWAFWKQLFALRAQKVPFSDISSAWRRSWIRSPRQHVEHQEQFLNKSQRALKSLLDQVAVTTEMGQRAFRRYRAACKWIDDVQRGTSFENIQQHWSKVKVGNKIAWSGEHALPYERIIKNWSWEERLIEAAFWQAPRWHVPSWVQRQLALTYDAWPKHDYDLQEADYMALWALGFESMVRNKISYDGWIAMQQICHPEGWEAVAFHAFFEEYLQSIFQS